MPQAITLVDNLNLKTEERSLFSNLVKFPPLNIKVEEWINLEDLVKGVSKNLGDEIHIIVATGGIEVYPKGTSLNYVYVFESPIFRGTNGPILNLKIEDYLKITGDPVKHHEAALSKLVERLKKYKGKNIKVIDCSIDKNGFKASRLCAIYKTISEMNPSTLLVGAAHKYYNPFLVSRKGPSTSFQEKGLYHEDLRMVMGINEIPYKIIFKCDNVDIRMASEVIEGAMMAYEGNFIINSKKFEEGYRKKLEKIIEKKKVRDEKVKERLDDLKQYII